jgi:hypothetical protein
LIPASTTPWSNTPVAVVGNSRGYSKWLSWYMAKSIAMPGEDGCLLAVASVPDRHR